ncbi:MAG: amidohydrolase family protein [Planctomycetota bacterium]
MAPEIAGRLLVDGRLQPGRVELEGDRIRRVTLDAGARGGDELPLVAPGLIDLHVHGFGGCDPYGDLAGMANALAGAGTTAFLPTLFPRRSAAALGGEADEVWRTAQSRAGGARALGVHLEGPFVNPGAVGGLPADELAEPSPEALAELLGPATGDGRGIRAITLAPELPGAREMIAELARCGVRASLGHSLATVAETSGGVQAGATGATHLFNAMRPLHHREAGIAGVALTADELCPEIIGDLVHVGREAFELALRARGADGLCLISDSLKGPGADGHSFCSHGKTCVVEDGSAWFDDETAEGGRRLTGTVLGQLDAVRRLVSRGVLGVEEALTMASASPARELGLEGELGTLAAGARADLLVLRGPELALAEVWVGGRRI